VACHGPSPPKKPWENLGSPELPWQFIGAWVQMTEPQDAIALGAQGAPTLLAAGIPTFGDQWLENAGKNMEKCWENAGFIDVDT